MKTLPALAVGATTLLDTGVTLAHNGNMMNGGNGCCGWIGGGGWMNYGGVWLPIFLVIVVIGLVAWIVNRWRLP